MIEARKALLDALEAIGHHRESMILAGAQAIYLQTPNFDSPVEGATRDADLTIDKDLLKADPLLDVVLTNNGFKLVDPPGRWETPDGIIVDLMVPAALVPREGRSVEMNPHSKLTARRTKGIEGCLVDHTIMRINSLDSVDQRSFDIRVAKPSALLIAKLHKVNDRINDRNVSPNKDAHDIYRLLAATNEVVFRIGLQNLLNNEISESVTLEGLEILKTLFAESLDSVGNTMAASATEGFGIYENVQNSSYLLASELIQKTI